LRNGAAPLNNQIAGYKLLVMARTAVQITLLSMSLVQSATTPLRIGDVATQLSQEDVAAIQRILPADAKPWLLEGERGQIPVIQFIEAYLSPTDTTAALRRGTVVTAMRRIRPPEPVGEWNVSRTDSYGQVAIPGRSFDDVHSEWDMNRPFRVIGRFSDDELVRLVQLVRSDPPVRPGVNHIQPWPILSIQRKDDDSVDVTLRGGHLQGQEVTLRQNGQDWVIVSVAMWIA
jgi:hypothetical protein